MFEDPLGINPLGGVQDALNSISEMQARFIRTKGGTELLSPTSDGRLVDPAGRFRGPAPVVASEGESPTPSAPSGPSNDFSAGNFGSKIIQGASVALPAILGISNFKNQDKSNLVPNFGEVSLSAPRVRGATAPRFTTKFRKASGSSLAEREGGLRFADAQNEARKQQFSAFNDEFIQKQEAQNNQTKNREAIINNQVNNQREGIRSSLQNTKLERQQSAGNKLISDAVYNAAQFSNQATQRNSLEKSRAFETLVSQGNYSSSDIDALYNKIFGVDVNKYDL